MKLTEEDRKKPMEDWKLAEWHKFFKQNPTISEYWADWKHVAPHLFLEKDSKWFGERNGDIV